MISVSTIQTNRRHISNEITFWGWLLPVAAGFVVCNYFCEGLVAHLFHAGHIPVLNALTGATDAAPLGFYQGMMKERWLGPVAQVLSAAGLLLVARRYLVRSSWKVFAAAVFVFLFLTKLDVLAFPPYGDAVGGPFVEAIWLKAFHFDYRELFYQPSYADGGARVYLFSIFPTYLAVLLTVLPDPRMFLPVNHVLVFAMTAVCTAALREWLRQDFEDGPATYGALIFAFLPLVQAQAEAINMEMPCLFFIMLSLWCLIEGRVNRAGLFVVAALLVKGIAVFAAAGFLAAAGLAAAGILPSETLRRSVALRVWAVMLAGLAVLKIVSKFFVHDQHVTGGMLSPLSGFVSLRQFVLTYIFLAAFAVFLWSLCRRPGGDGESRRISATTWLVFVFTLMWFALFLNFRAVSPRYHLSVYPLVVYCGLWALYTVWPSVTAARRCAAAGVLVAALGSYGLFYTPMEENDHVLLERSLEYRNDLKVNQLALSLIEEKFDHQQIVAPFVIAQMLAMPEYGYVHKKLNVMMYGFRAYYGDIKEFPGINGVDIKNTVYVGVKSQPVHDDLSYPVNPRDLVLNTIEYGNKKIWIFMGGISIDSVLRVTRMYMIRQAVGRAGPEAAEEIFPHEQSMPESPLPKP